MNYLEFTFTLEDQEMQDILIALLAEMGFDTFDETGHLLLAYTDADAFDEARTEALNTLCAQLNCSYRYTTMADKNWNEEWEKQFQPVIIENRCIIRAPFHQADDAYEQEIIIAPRMAFGTGHHASTYLMVQAMMDMDLSKKTICDAGTGTGVLAILAAKLGATDILALDNNEWAYNNALDNLALNDVLEVVDMQLAEPPLIQDKKFDVILANINRSVILEYMELFRHALNDRGTLLLSGILTADMPLITRAAASAGLQEVRNLTREDWSCVEYTIHAE